MLFNPHPKVHQYLEKLDNVYSKLRHGLRNFRKSAKKSDRISITQPVGKGKNITDQDFASFMTTLYARACNHTNTSNLRNRV